jgi:Zn-dependent protease with chaperone function
MSLDGANRSFLVFVSITLLLAAYVLCGVLGAVLVPLLVARASGRGLAALLDDVTLLAMLLLAAVVAVGLARASRSLVQQMLASRRLARRIRVLACVPPDRLTRAVIRSELRGRVVLVDAPESFSFVYGALTPRVAISRGLLQCVSGEELRAVLEHECYHVRNLDPLKVVLVRALSAALPFLPVLNSLRAHYLANRELAADRRAIVACGRRPLAGALMKVVRGPQWSELDVVAALGGVELLSLRLTQLETGIAPRLKSLGLARATIPLLGSTLLPIALLASLPSLGGAVALQRTTVAVLTTDTLLASLSCAAPFAGAGLLAYLAIALRAGRPLGSEASPTR